MNQVINECIGGLNTAGRVFCSYAAGVSVQAAILVVVLLIVDLFLRKRVRAVVRYCVWLLVLVKLILPPTLALPTGIGYWVGDRLPAALPQSLRVSATAGFQPDSRDLSPGPALARDASRTGPSKTPASAAGSVNHVAAAMTPIRWQGILLLLWLVGVFVFAALLAQRVRFVRGLMAFSSPAETRFQQIVDESSRQVGIRQRISLRVSGTMSSPAICGLVRPVILVPAKVLDTLSPDGVRAVLIHELTHMKRGDLWINSLQTLLQVIHFYNPFVWVANSVIRRTREEAVDETVLVALGGRAKDYSNTLIDIGEMALWKADLGLRLIGVAESEKILRWRIKHMLTRPIPKSAKLGVTGTVVLAVMAAMLLPMACAERSSKDVSAMQPATSEGAAERARPGAWYYHVKSDGTGGRPVQSEADPGLSSCWNSIQAAFMAVKGRATPGPWIIQIDDEATYDEAVVLTDLQTSATETLTLTKAPWLAGRPTICPSQAAKRALAINGLWKGVATSDALPDQPGQPANRVTYLTVRGFTLKNNAHGTDNTTEQALFSDKQAYLTEGLHIFEDCCFDGQNQVYDFACPMFIDGTCINTVFRRNTLQNLRRNEEAMKESNQRDLFAVTPPKSTVMEHMQVIIADNTFCGNRGTVFVSLGDTANQRYYEVVFERNTLRDNYYPSILVTVWRNPLSNIVRNNIFSNNSGGSDARAAYESHHANNTRIYHNTFVNNHVPCEVRVTASSTQGIEIKNNLFWPTPGSTCIEVAHEATEHLVCANNAFFTDVQKDGYPPGFGFGTTENTEIIGLWDGEALTTNAWNKASKNNSGNGYVHDGPGLDKSMRLVAGSLCIDRGVGGLTADDVDGRPRPMGSAFDVGADEHETPYVAGSLAGEQEPPPAGQHGAPDTPLCLAAYRGDLAGIGRCIKEGGDVGKLDRRGYAALHYAAQGSQKQAVEAIIAKGGDVDIRDSRGQTALFFASAAGNGDMVQLLISRGAVVNLRDADGQRPLDLAMRQHRKDVVELLKGTGAEAFIQTAVSTGDINNVRYCLEKGADINARDKNLQTPLHVAVANQTEDVSELLVSQGADLNAKDENGYTPLYYAVWNKDQDMVRLLVAKGADVSYTPKDDYPLLHHAVWFEDANTVRLLVDNGARFDVKDRDGYSALRHAAQRGGRDILEILLGKEIDASTLALAACAGNLARVKSLVEQGAEVDAKDELGWTPLCWATCAGRMEVARLLVEKGADVGTRFEDGQTPLHVAAKNGRKDIAEPLIAGGADVNARAESGATPLHDAARHGHKPVVELLLAKGADVTAKMPDGSTPLYLAIRRGDNELVGLLAANGADVTARLKTGQTLLGWTRLWGSAETIRLLQKHGAKE